MPEGERLCELGNVFARFAEEASNGGCPLYTVLAEGVSDDTHVLDIASSARRPPVPNLLFAAVHYLLLRGAAHVLSSFYASLKPDPSPAEDAYPYFRDFCMEHESDLRGLMSTRLVQTNECRALLVPAPRLRIHSGRNAMATTLARRRRRQRRAQPALGSIRIRLQGPWIGWRQALPCADRG